MSLESRDPVITAVQMRAARALLGIDQRQLAQLSGVSLPTVQRMEASEGNVRGVVDTLTKVVEAFDRAGIVLIGDNATSPEGGRGVRFKQAWTQTATPSDATFAATAVGRSPDASGKR
jgi:transcriptional regulator with XRE-family HTH domain